MTRFVVQRVLGAIPVLFLVTLITLPASVLTCVSSTAAMINIATTKLAAGPAAHPEARS